MHAASGAGKSEGAAATATMPCAAVRPAFLAAAARPFLRSQSMAASSTPPHASSAALHSEMGAPVAVRSAFTAAAEVGAARSVDVEKCALADRGCMLAVVAGAGSACTEARRAEAVVVAASGEGGTTTRPPNMEDVAARRTVRRRSSMVASQLCTQCCEGVCARQWERGDVRCAAARCSVAALMAE